uniref:SSD domain-containing protein n=1 Tax=Heligmosomoides polygyrus TaxID=6339 RepID=A0A183FXL1_HELPZ
LDEFVRNTSAVVDGKVVHFNDLRSIDINYLFHWYKYAYSWSDYFADVNLSFPIGEAMGHKFFLGTHFFGVNKHKDSERGPIEQMEFVTLWYMSQASDYATRQRLQAIQMRLFELSRADNFSDLISFDMYGDQVANAEMLRGTFQTVNLFVVGLILMVGFMAIAFSHISLRSQPLLILGAIGSPALATAACFAILGWVDFPLNSIMCITPFLVMGIGVDDAFLLLHSWRNHGNLPAKERMRAVVHEIGPSMAITSATNTLAFGIGITSPTPQMSGFCLCTCIAIFLDFLFEFLIFCPVIVLCYKEKKEKSPQRDRLVLLYIWRGCFSFSTPAVFFFSVLSWEKFTDVLLSPYGRFIVIVSTVAIYISAFVGISQMRPSFDPSKTFPSDSDLMISLRKFEKVQSEYSPVNFISRMPSLKDSAEESAFFEMVERVEYSDGCYGPERTQLMLRDFIDVHTSNVTLSYDSLPQFLNERQIKDKAIVHYEDKNGSVSNIWINYIIICRGRPSFFERAMKIDSIRKIIDEYPVFQTSLFDYDSTIYDLIIAVKDELTKAVAITFACMTAACAFMIPSFTGASVATLSIMCLFSFLTSFAPFLPKCVMKGCNAHVCYHYHTSMRECVLLNVNERITKILRAVGRPIFEASLSTLICMSPLFFVPVYIIVAFAKTVCLVATLGLLHGVVIIPVCLAIMTRQRKPSRRPEDLLGEQKENMLGDVPRS